MFRNNTSSRTTIVPVAGQRAYARPLNNVQSHVLFLTFRGTVNTTVPGTRINNNGSILGAYDYVQIEENGRDTHVIDARTLGYLSELAASSPRSATRTGFGVGTTPVVEQVAVWFAHPFQVNVRETAYLERDPKTTFQVSCQLRADGGFPGMVSGGSAAGTLSGLTVDVDQEFDPAASDWPLFMPMVRQYTEAVSAANAAQISYIKSSNYLRGLILQQDSNIGEVSDILNKVVLRSDARDIIGPAGLKADNLKRSLEQRHGGNLSPSYSAFWFQRQGRLASILNAANEPNLRLEMDVQPSVTAGATSSSIRVTLLELVRDNWQDPQSGRRVTSPSLNIPGL